MLPNFLIIGAEKAATTWLHRVLGRHPDVFLPATKETHFFNAATSNGEPRRFYEELGLEWYQRFFAAWEGEAAVGEATPMYLCDPEAPGRIHRHLPGVRLVACLRHPVERANSHYRMAAAKGHTDRSFAAVVEAGEERFVGRGDYHLQLARYAELFPAGRIHVQVFEELVAAPAKGLAKLLDFLGVEAGTFLDEVPQGPVYEASAIRSRAALGATRRLAIWMRTHRGPDRVLGAVKASGLAAALKDANRRPGSDQPLDPALRAALWARYEPGVRQLEQLLGRSLPWDGEARVPGAGP